MTTPPLTNAEIQSAFQCPANRVSHFREALDAAASEEYANMVTGRYSITTIGAAREFRLFLLVKHAYPGTLPSPGVVANLFRVSPTQGRSLLRTCLVRYREELKDNTRAQAKALLDPITADEDGIYRLATDADYLVEAMNAELPQLGNELRRIIRFTGTAALYRVEEETRDALISLA
jgi:hypothetical protein